MKTLNISRQIADLCVKQGRLDDAEAIFRQLLIKYTDKFGIYHTLTLTRLAELRNSFKKDDAQKSEAMLPAALQGLEEACGPSSELTARAARTLGGVLLAHDKFAEPEKGFQRLLCISKRI